MIAKYDLPNDPTTARLPWHGTGPWKRTILCQDEIRHNFPKPHTDLLEQFIDSHMPVEKLAPAGSPTPAATAATAGGSSEDHALRANIGQPAPQSLLDKLDIDITPSGEGLPAGSGTVAEGGSVFAQHGARCHGQDGSGTPLASRLILGDQGEPGPWQYGDPRTVANYWPYLTTYMDYIRRAMPFDQPTALTDAKLYAVTAWLLNRNGMLEDDATADRNRVLEMNELPNLPNFFSCYPQTCCPEPELRGDGGGAPQGGAGR